MHPPATLLLSLLLCCYAPPTADVQPPKESTDLLAAADLAAWIHYPRDGKTPREHVWTLDDGVLRLTMNRPQARNALSMEMLAALKGALDEAAQNDDVRAIVIAAEGPGFCGGHDLKQMTAQRENDDGGRAHFEDLFRTCSELMQAIVDHPKVIIAEVQGIATAAGCQLVAACDICLTIYRATKETTWSPNKMFDGLAAGRPILINVAGWLGETIDSNQCGQSVDSENPESLANALERLADDPNLRAEMGRNSRELADREFSREKLAIKLEGVLQSAIEDFRQRHV